MEINLSELHTRELAFINSITDNKKYLNGNSLVTTCYSSEVPSMWVLLHELKRLNFLLPIEIFYRENELSTYEKYILQSILPNQIKIKKITGTPKDFVSRYGHTHGWACKIYAIYESEYENIIWIDADNVPIDNPTFLFEDKEYLKKGSLFWRDMLSTDSANQYASDSVMWQIFGLPVNDAEPFESGQLLLNKKKCFREIELIKYYADNCEIYYNFGGDKETFKFAFQKTAYLNNCLPLPVNYHSDPAVPFGFMPYGCISKGKINQYNKWGGGSVMVHRDRNGKEIFNHRNMNKFTLNKNVFNLDITNEHIYHEHIEKLKIILGVK